MTTHDRLINGLQRFVGRITGQEPPKEHADIPGAEEVLAVKRAQDEILLRLHLLGLGQEISTRSSEKE